MKVKKEKQDTRTTESQHPEVKPAVDYGKPTEGCSSSEILGVQESQEFQQDEVSREGAVQVSRSRPSGWVQAKRETKLQVTFPHTAA